MKVTWLSWLHVIRLSWEGENTSLLFCLPTWKIPPGVQNRAVFRQLHEQQMNLYDTRGAPFIMSLRGNFAVKSRQSTFWNLKTVSGIHHSSVHQVKRDLKLFPALRWTVPWKVSATSSPCGLPSSCRPSDRFSVWNQAQSSAVLAWLHKLALLQLIYSNGCKRHWEVLEMMALTVSDTNHCWKGDSSIWLLFAEWGGKKYLQVNFGAFWSLIHTGCGKCVCYIHISKESFWREETHRGDHLTPSPLQHFDDFLSCRCQSSGWQTILSWTARGGPAPHRSRRAAHTRQRWIFEATPGCVSCRQHLTGLNWSQGRYESRHCLSKPGNNQPHHPPQGPSWKSLAQNNVLLLLLVFTKKKGMVMMLLRITITIWEGLNYAVCLECGRLQRGHCQRRGRLCWKIGQRLCSSRDYNQMMNGD